MAEKQENRPLPLMAMFERWNRKSSTNEAPLRQYREVARLNKKARKIFDLVGDHAEQFEVIKSPTKYISVTGVNIDHRPGKSDVHLAYVGNVFTLEIDTKENGEEKITRYVFDENGDLERYDHPVLAARVKQEDLIVVGSSLSLLSLHVESQIPQTPEP